MSEKQVLALLKQTAIAPRLLSLEESRTADKNRARHREDMKALEEAIKAEQQPRREFDDNPSDS